MIQDRSIPQELLGRAKGLAFLTVIKGYITKHVHSAEILEYRRMLVGDM